MNILQKIKEISNQLNRIATASELRIENSPKAYRILKTIESDMLNLIDLLQKLVPDRGRSKLYLASLKAIQKGINRVLKDLETPSQSYDDITEFVKKLECEFNEVSNYLIKDGYIQLDAQSSDASIKPFTLIRSGSNLRETFETLNGKGMTPKKCCQIFISYSRKDSNWLERLHVHLRPLERTGTIESWDDTKIKPGTKWREAIREAVESAKVAVLLISADFLASDFISTNELPPLLMAAESKGAIVLPVIISPCRFHHVASISQFQSVNPPDQPLINMSQGEREAIFVKITEVIEDALKI